jgi:hypothetical protein
MSFLIDGYGGGGGFVAGSSYFQVRNRNKCIPLSVRRSRTVVVFVIVFVIIHEAVPEFIDYDYDNEK